ncbi:MAG TPA: helix-turn-helix domain-containing protein [Polyangia bacterium]|nr:helix-turn-helix domain-containing protein [Polyangia bacterium]
MKRTVSRPARGKPADTAARIVDAALVVFNRDGYFATDSNALARAAGYSPATFYKHFDDKRALFIAVYTRWVHDEWQELQAIVADGGTPMKLARRIVAAVAAQHERARGMRAALRVLVHQDATVRAAFVAHRREQLIRMRALGHARHSRAADALVMLTLERVCDAIADGEAQALGATPASLITLVERQIADYFER